MYGRLKTTYKSVRLANNQELNEYVLRESLALCMAKEREAAKANRTDCAQTGLEECGFMPMVMQATTNWDLAVVTISWGNK